MARTCPRSATGPGIRDGRHRGPRRSAEAAAADLLRPPWRNGLVGPHHLRAGRLGATAQVETDLAEWDYGDYEGQRSVDIRRQRPDWDVWRDGRPDGAMPAEVGVRADRVIARLRNLDGPVILFSHGQFGRVLATRWIGRPAVEGLHFALDPASIGIWPPWSSRWASR